MDPSRINAACLQGGMTPEIALNDGFSGADWNDPHVLRVGSEYWLYASSNLGISQPPSNVRIYRFTSTDASTWTLNPTTPVLTEGTGADWDAGGAETPAVVFFGGQYHLFYTGYPEAWPNGNAFHFKVGHAISDDGVTFTKQPFVLESTDPTASFHQYITGEPGPVVFHNTLMLYFSAVGLDAALGQSLQTVGVTTSVDATVWTDPVQVLKPDQTAYPRAANWVGYSTPNAAVIGDQVHLFVDVANDHGNSTWTQEALHHAWSADGFTAWTQDAQPLRRLSDFTWTQREIRSPAAFVDGTTLHLFFAGDDYFAHGAWGIGHMSCGLVP